MATALLAEEVRLRGAFGDQCEPDVVAVHRDIAQEPPVPVGRVQGRIALERDMCSRRRESMQRPSRWLPVAIRLELGRVNLHDADLPPVCQPQRVAVGDTADGSGFHARQLRRCRRASTAAGRDENEQRRESDSRYRKLFLRMPNTPRITSRST